MERGEARRGTRLNPSGEKDWLQEHRPLDRPGSPWDSAWKFCRGRFKVASEILSRDPRQTSGRLRRRILKLRGEIYSDCQLDWIRRGTNKNATYSTPRRAGGEKRRVKVSFFPGRHANPGPTAKLFATQI